MDIFEQVASIVSMGQSYTGLTFSTIGQQAASRVKAVEFVSDNQSPKHYDFIFGICNQVRCSRSDEGVVMAEVAHDFI